MGWMTSWEASWAAYERGRNTPERLVVICGASRRSLKLLLVRPAAVKGRGITLIDLLGYILSCLMASEGMDKYIPSRLNFSLPSGLVHGLLRLNISFYA